MARTAVTILLVVAMVYVTYAFPEYKIPTKCDLNEEFKECGTACEPTCIEPAPKMCNRMCNRGCQCKEGYLRSHEGGKCVLQRQCLLREQNALP